MAQHDYVLDNANGATFRADANNALAAIVSNNSGTSAPSTTYAYQWWQDTTNAKLKIRNSANSAWIEVANLSSTYSPIIDSAGITYASGSVISADGTQLVIQADTNDTLVYNKSSNYWQFTFGGTSEMIVNGLAIYPTTSGGMSCGATASPWSVVYANNGTIQASDRRLKDHIGAVQNVGCIIDCLEPVRFVWKDTGKLDIGFYAQDVEPLVPEACEPGDETINWGFKPDRLIPLLVAEIKELRSRVLQLERASELGGLE